MKRKACSSEVEVAPKTKLIKTVVVPPAFRRIGSAVTLYILGFISTHESDRSVWSNLIRTCKYMYGIGVEYSFSKLYPYAPGDIRARWSRAKLMTTLYPIRGDKFRWSAIYIEGIVGQYSAIYNPVKIRRIKIDDVNEECILDDALSVIHTMSGPGPDPGIYTVDIATVLTYVYKRPKCSKSVKSIKLNGLDINTSNAFYSWSFEDTNTELGQALSRECVLKCKSTGFLPNASVRFYIVIK